MDVWGPARVSGEGHECYFLVVVHNYTRYTTVFPLHSKGEVPYVLIPWIRAVRLQLRERFSTDLPVLHLHSNRGGEFSSDLLQDLCRGEGILQSFTLPASPQQNGIAERYIGLGRSYLHDPSGCSPFFVAACGPCLFPNYPAPLPLLPLFLAPNPPPVDPLPPQGPAPSGMSQVAPLPGTLPVEVVVDSSAARGAASWGAELGGAEPAGAEPEGAEPEGAGSGGVELGGAEPGGAEPERAEPGGAEPEGVEPEGAKSEGAESGGAKLGGSLSPGGPLGAMLQQEPLSPPQLREWFAWRTRLWSGAAGAGGSAAGGTGALDPGGSGAAGAGGAAGVEAGGTGAGAAGGTGAAGPGGARTGGTGVAGAGGVAGVGAGDTGAGGAGPRGAGAVGAGSGDTGWPRPQFVPLLRQPASRLLAPSPYTEQTGGLTMCREPVSCPALPVRAVGTGCRVPRKRPPPVPGTHHMALRPSSVPLRVPLPSSPMSSLADGPDLESDLVHATSPTVPSFESAAASALVAELVDFAAACRLDYAASLVAESVSECPPSVGEAITGPYSSQWKTAMDIEMASWKSTCTYVNEVSPFRANIVDGMWIFRVKWPPGTPPTFKARYIARGFSQRQGVEIFQTFSPTPKMTTLWVLLHVPAQHDYELLSLDFSTAFLQGSLHEEIWLRRPPGFTGSILAGTQWSLRRSVYGLRQGSREWHDTLRMTLATLGFVPSTADPLLFLRTDTSLPPFNVLIYVDDLVFATANTEALALVKSELQKRHTCTDLGELRSYLGLQITRDRARHTITLNQSHMVHQVLQCFGFRYSSPQFTPLPTCHSLSAPPSDESVEPSGPYPELVGCLITSGMELVLGGRGPVVFTGHADILGSSCEAEIYAGAMAAQELR
ncbi:unnamed protein product [Closterium sp. NIES-53]